MSSTLRVSGRRQHVVDQLVGQRGIEAGRGLVEDQHRAAGDQGPGHGQPPPLTPRDRDPFIADGRLEAGGSVATHPLSWAASRAASTSSSVASGRPSVTLERTVPANSWALWSTRAHAARTSDWARPVDGDPAQVSTPSSRGQKRRSALTRLDLPAPLEPVTATRPRAATASVTPSRARGRSGA
jgi:hypothetical protein